MSKWEDPPGFRDKLPDDPAEIERRVLAKLKRVAIRHELRARQGTAIEIEARDIVNLLEAVAFGDTRALFVGNEPKPIQELTAAEQLVVAGIEVEERWEKNGDRVVSIKYRLCDRLRAGETLGKYLGMFKDRLEVTGLESLVQRLAEARQRVLAENLVLEGETK